MKTETAMSGERTAALLSAALKMCGSEKRAAEMGDLAETMRRRAIKASMREEFAQNEKTR